MAITLVGAAGLLGSVVIFEGLAAILEAIEGDPEADVQVALQRLAANNQRRAVSIEAVKVGAAEDLDRKFAAFNQIPGRALSEVALAQQGGQFASQPNTGLLDFVTSQLRVPGHQLEKLSSPSRMGDMSSVHRAIGKSLPQEPPPTGNPTRGG